MGLGGYPDVTLANAREAARSARAKVREGVDPVEEARAARALLKAAQANAVSFRSAAESYIDTHEPGWRNAKHAQQWRNTLTAYAYPQLGEMLVRDIELHHILRVLEPIWRTKTETATRVRARIEKVLDWSTTRGYRQGLNPARWKAHLDTLLPAPSKIAKKDHHPALPVAEAGAFMARLREHSGTGALALEFAILTASRSGEVRGATWREIDLAERTWTIPKERMKAEREHKVPLSEPAVAVLNKLLAEQVSSGGLPRPAPEAQLFPAPRGGELSDSTLNAVIKRMGLSVVQHGFRSTFRDWCSERTNYPNEVAEMALAHSIPNKVEAAYRRGDLFEKRRTMMADWAKFLARVEKPAQVIDIQRKRA